MIVTLAGIDLSQTAMSGWVIRSLPEWWDLPESKAPVTPRPAASGVFPSTNRTRDALRPTLVLRWKGGSAAEASIARRELRAFARQDVPLTVDDGTGPLTRTVQVWRVSVSPDFDWWHMPVSVDLLARDPAAYGPEVCRSSGLPVAGSGIQWPLGPDGTGTAGGFIDWGSAGSPGQVEVENPGSDTAYPTLTVSGVLDTGFQVIEVETGRRLRFDRPVLAGSQIRLDSRTGRASINGQSDVTSFLTVAEWPEIPAGATRRYQFLSLGASSGSPQLTVCASATYL